MPTAVAHTREEQVRRIRSERLSDAETRQKTVREFDAATLEIQKIRKEVEDIVAKLHDKAQGLRSLARRSEDEGANSLLVFANAHVRLAGALSQGVKRAASMDRVLDRVQHDRDDAQRREVELQQRREAVEHAKLVAQYQQPSTNAFDDVYGDLLDEEVSDA